MNESEQILRVVAYLSSRGWPVDMYSFDLHQGGRCHYPCDEQGPLIQINVCAAAEALYVLGHEAGHALCYEEIPGYLNLGYEEREYRAWTRGWQLLESLGVWLTEEERAEAQAPFR